MRQIRPDTLLNVFLEAPIVRAFAEALGAGKSVAAEGSHGSSTTLLAGATTRLLQRRVVLVVAHLDEADEAMDELQRLGVEAHRLCALELSPGESNVSLDLLAERFSLLRRISEGGLADECVIICPIHALMQRSATPQDLAALTKPLRVGEEHAPEEIVRWLDEAGYKRVDAIEEPGDFAVRGGIIDVFAPTPGERGEAEFASAPVRLDFFGDELESIAEIDLETMGSDRRLEALELVTTDAEAIRERSDGPSPLALMPESAVAILHETMEVTEQGRGYFERATGGSIVGPPAVLKLLQERFRGFAEINQFSKGAPGADVRMELPTGALRGFSTVASEAVGELFEEAESGRIVVVCDSDAELARLRELVSEFTPEGADPDEIEAMEAHLHRGFVWLEGERSVAFAPHHELLHRYQSRRRIRRLRAGRAMDTFLELEAGDYVVHAEHGIAKFAGLKRMKRRKDDKDAGSEEFLTLEFAASAKLHVPVDQIEKVQKYVGGFRGSPPLSTLGGKRWAKQKEQVQEAVRDLAAEMLRIQAAREHLPGIRFPADTGWQREFEAEFPYQETDDQLAALGEIKRDMQQGRPMDRLLCGDVGYGKTELAIRAAFKAAEYGRQVAMLAPTTVLAEQHERTFRERFADYPFRVESVSRFKSAGEAKKILDETAKGRVDILIGTHRLLSKDVRFADLGLVIVDEEQRFGVEHKQTLLSLRTTVDVLTLSATPIPRTLHMSLLGIRDISSLATPPLDRRSIVTEVIPYNENRIRQAIAREMNREGQVFFVHNRVHNIRRVADDVQKLAPEAKILVGHGQMSGKELEQVMLKFIRRQADILVCTTIIESGIDIPTANTMIINDADRFGLADLHQLRGRVGRHKHRAYCYLLLPETRTVSKTAKRRLKAVEEFSMLGAGFKIAMRDLEIRGAGNLLGKEQSGHIAAVGYDMYCRLLERSVRELKHEEEHAPSETSVEIGLTGSLPKAYIPSDMRRMEAYRRVAQARTPEDLERVEQDLADAYGDPPPTAERLLELAALRIHAGALGVRSIVMNPPDVILRCEDPLAVQESLEGAQGTVRVIKPTAKTPDPNALTEVFFRPPSSYLEPVTLLRVLRKRFAQDEAALARA